MAKIIKAQQLADQVIEHLKSSIAKGAYGIGTKLPSEPELTEELGIGRSTLREAIRVLAHNGILEVRQGDGTYVRSLPADGEPLGHRLKRAKVREIQEVRRSLEIEIVRLAAMRRTKADLEQIKRCLKKREAALLHGDTSALLDTDIVFHCAVAAATGNEVFADLYRTFAQSLRNALSALWDTEDNDTRKTAQLHHRLVAAIAARNPEEAAHATTALLDRHNASLTASAAITSSSRKK